MKVIYTAHVTSVAGRDGNARSDDGKIDLQLGRPGSSDEGTNPEQLFAAGYSACFGSAIAHVAKLKQIEAGEVLVEAEVSLLQDDSGFSLMVGLHTSIEGVDEQTAQQLVATAHTVCPYSKATRGNIQVSLSANGQEVAQAA